MIVLLLNNFVAAVVVKLRHRFYGLNICFWFGYYVQGVPHKNTQYFIAFIRNSLHETLRRETTLSSYDILTVCQYQRVFFCRAPALLRGFIRQRRACSAHTFSVNYFVTP